MERRVDDLTVHYEVCGEGSPVVILNGAGPDLRSMQGPLERVFDRCEGWKRFYVDIPGTGKTKVTKRIRNSDQVLDIVMGFIDSVLPGQRFAVVGSSYGGYLARGVIYKEPGMVDGLLIVCPTVIADRKKRTLPQHVALLKDDEFLSSLDLADRGLFESFAVVQTKAAWKRTLDEVITGLRMADTGFFSRLESRGYAYSFDVDGLPSPFRMPTLILSGRQDSMVGYRDTWELIESYPRATFAVLDLAGHNLPIEQESLLTALVGEWLDRMLLLRAGASR